jgi:hypothetical protein
MADKRVFTSARTMPNLGAGTEFKTEAYDD